MALFNLLRVVAVVLLCSWSVAAQDGKYQPVGDEIPGPKTPAEFASWLADIQHWRMERRIRIAYDGSEYDRPELQWTQRAFVQPQMMCEERYFYDAAACRYTVDRYVDSLEKRYGGIDAVLIWHTYPNIGIDARNQNDLLRDMPGGVAGVRQMIADFHRRGVRVLFPVMNWDQGTRPEGVDDWTALVRLLADVGADGINGDTMNAVPHRVRALSDEMKHPLAFEGEHMRVDLALGWNHLSWGQFTGQATAVRQTANFIPGVSRNKWLEPRHMMNICDRYDRDRISNLQHAFFNGTGYESWEDVWGLFNGMTPRAAEALRRVSRLSRAFSSLLVSPDWEPHTPTLQFGVFSSKFPGAGKTLWTLINRTESDIRGDQLRIPHQGGKKYYDLWHGVELTPKVRDESAWLEFEIEGNGFGAVLTVDAGATMEGLDGLLRQMKDWNRGPLRNFSHEWTFLPQKMVEIPPTKPAASAPNGMIRIPAGEFEFKVSNIQSEGAFWNGLDVQYPWENSPRRHHRKWMSMKSYYIDRYPVTNADFKKFLEATHYLPKDDHNFLRDWSAGTFPAGWTNRPVTWVSLEDARAYASWAGKRLPHEWEWQYAAQGTDGRLYPWGSQWNAEAVPAAVKGRALPGPAAVDGHPKGASPFGVMDLTGNVWQWTSEFVDEHTRTGILRGGSYYQPQGAQWYFPQAYKLDEHGNYYLMAPSKDRSGTVGFRCVLDAS